MINHKSNLTYIKRFGRRHSVYRYGKSILDRCLQLLSRQYLNNGRRQLAAYSFDLIGGKINTHGQFEVEELEAVTEWLKRHNYVRDSCIDIGANIGNHSLHFADLYEQVYAFEPYPRTYKLLEINAQLVRNLKTFNLGLSDKRASVCFDVNPRNFGGSSIQMDNSNVYSVGNRFVIEVDRLDSIPDIKSAKIGLVKIDVEGHELQVLEGALQTIAKNRPVILFEQHPRDFLNGTSNVIQLLKSMGYETFATIQRFPTVGGPRVLRLPINHLLRLVFGYCLEIRPQHRFPAGVYSMIIAVP